MQESVYLHFFKLNVLSLAILVNCQQFQLFTSILHSLWNAQRVKNAKSFPLTLLISLLTLQKPTCKNTSDSCKPRKVVCCFTLMVIIKKKKLLSPSKTVQSHLFSWVWASAQLLQEKTASSEELILASEGAHFNPPASIPITTDAWSGTWRWAMRLPVP